MNTPPLHGASRLRGASRRHRPAPLRHAAGLLVAAAALLGAATAFAAEDESGVPGEVMIKTPFKFVKFTVDGRRTWENHTYIDGDKTLHIFGLSRDDTHTIVVQPRMEPGYLPVELTIDPEKFKRKRVRRDSERIIVFQQVFRVKFKKAGSPPDKASPRKKSPRKKSPRKKSPHKKSPHKKSPHKKSPHKTGRGGHHGEHEQAKPEKK